MSEKKPALLLVPTIGKDYRRDEYLYLCIEKVMEEGFMPLLPALYEKTSVIQDEFIETLIPHVSAVFFFTNFGIDKTMFNAMELAWEKIEVHYRRITQKEVDALQFTTHQVLLDVCKKTGFKPEDLYLRSRVRELVEARFIYFRRAREVTTASLEEIGDVLGLDHATVLYGIRKAREERELRTRYERYYYEKKEDEKTLPIEAPVLPNNPNDSREHRFPSGKANSLALIGREYNNAFHGYKPHE